MRSSRTDTDDIAQIQKRSTILLAILAAIAFAFATAPAYSNAIITAGFDERPDLGDGGDALPVELPTEKTAQQLVGLGVDVSDTGYFWWSDGTVTRGSGRGAADLADAQPFNIPSGKRVSEIVGMAIDEHGHVYTYFNDYTVSIGDPFDLDSIDRPRPYILPIGYAPNNIIGVAMLDDDVALFFRDGTHHYTDVNDYRNFTITAPDYQSSKFTVPTGFNTSNVAGMDFADSDGRLYTMFVTSQQTNDRQVQHAGIANTTNAITIEKDGWSLTLPHR